MPKEMAVVETWLCDDVMVMLGMVALVLAVVMVVCLCVCW